MTAHNEQIITAFEVNGMSPEDISSVFGMDIVAIKAVLFQNSSLYRKESKVETTLQFSDEEAVEMKGILLNIARYEEENQSLKFKAAKFILEDRKGRLDIGKQMPTFNLNVLAINERLAKALAGKERTAKKAVEITSSKELVNG